TIVSDDGIVVRHLSATAAAGSTSITWDGRSDAGGGVADGRYLLVVLARDAAGNASTSVTVPVSVYRALSKVAATPTIFYPQDRDTLAPSTSLSFVLTSAANVT